MKVRCAWCKKIRGEKPPYGGKYADQVTDGICYDCLAKYFPESKVDKKESSHEAKKG